MNKEYCITYSGSKQAGFTPVVSAPHIAEPLLYLSNRTGNYIRYDDPYQAEAHAGHYLCKILNQSCLSAEQAGDPTHEMLEALELLEETAGETVAELNQKCGLDNDTTTITEVARDKARAVIARANLSATTSKCLPPTTKIWLLHVSHKHGDNYEAFTSLEAAQRGLHSYVTEWWDDGLTEQYGDLNALSHDEAIDAYFDAYANALDPEHYALEEVTLSTSQP